MKKRKNKHKRNRHALLAQRNYLRRKRLKAKKKQKNPNKNARKVEKRLVRGVDQLMRQERANRIKLFNNWKMYYDNRGHPIVLI